MNMFDAQVDAVRSALNSMGFKNVEIVVAETGWPFVLLLFFWWFSFGWVVSGYGCDLCSFGFIYVMPTLPIVDMLWLFCYCCQN